MGILYEIFIMSVLFFHKVHRMPIITNNFYVGPILKSHSFLLDIVGIEVLYDTADIFRDFT
jgi:hypothetical protein